MKTDLDFLVGVKQEVAASSQGPGEGRQAGRAREAALRPVGKRGAAYTRDFIHFPSLSQIHVNVKVWFWDSELYFSLKTETSVFIKENLENIFLKK